MQIKTYNRAVDPNTIQGQVQTSSDVNAYGGNIAGSNALREGLGEVNKQIQAYVDDQINMSVIDAKNKYEADMNDLLNNPDTGLLNQQDMNALDVVKKYQEGEYKIRQNAFSSLPNYRKAHDAFANMAQDVSTQRLGQVMKYQYTKDVEHRTDTWNIFATNEMDNLVQGNNADKLFKGFNRLTASAYSIWGTIYGKDKIDAMVREKATEMADSVLTNLVASGNASDYDKATNLLEKISPWVDDSKLTKMRSVLWQRKHDNSMMNLAKEAWQKFPNDPKAREKYIRENSWKNIVVGGANTGNNTVNMFVDAAKEFGVNPRKLLAIGMVETGGRTIDGMHFDENGGYGQITDGTAQYYNIDELFPHWRTDERQNIRAAAYIYKKKIEENSGDEDKGVYAYNGGGDPDYMTKWQESYNSLDGYDLSGGSGAADFENNLITGFQNAADIPQNGANGCAEEALQILAYANPWAADAYKKGLFNVEAMANAAKDAGIQEIAYDPNNLSVGDLVIYKTKEGDYGHTVVFDGHGGFYGNSSSANDGQGGKVHGNDINIPGMTPQYILKTGAGTSVGMSLQTVQVYDEEEIQRVISLSNNYQAQEERNTKIANDALVQQGAREMQQLHQAREIDPAAYLTIAEKYGKDNPDVYRSLKSMIGTYAVSLSASGGGTGGSGTGNSRGQGSSDMVVLKSLFGTNGIETFQDIQIYCVNHGITLSPANLQALQKAANDYQNGTGEYSPMYNITAQQIEDASGIDKATFEGNWPVIQQIVRGEAVKYRAAHGGQEPPLNELIQFGINAVTSDSTNGGYSQAQMRAAGILRITVGDDGYAMVTDWNHKTHTLDQWHVQDVLEGRKTLSQVLENPGSDSGDSSYSGDADRYSSTYDTNAKIRNMVDSSPSITDSIKNEVEYVKNKVASWFDW